MSVRTLLILRGVIAAVMAVAAVLAFVNGRTVIGVFITAFVITNVVIIVTIARRSDFAWRLLGIARRRR